MDKQGIIDYVLDTPTNTNPRILGHMLEEYAAGGGDGGGGDFSIAEVTLINNTSDNLSLNAFVCVEAGELGEDSPKMLYNAIDIAVGEQATYKVPMYSGGAFWGSMGLNIETTGGVAFQNGGLMITGNGTATFGTN